MNKPKRYPKTIPFGSRRLRPPRPDEEPGDQSPQALADERWTLALEAADDWGDLKALAGCFAANLSLSDELRQQLVDLLNQPQRRLTPYYSLNDRQRKLIGAWFRYRASRSRQETAAQTSERVARECGVSETDLTDCVAGKGDVRDRLRRERWDWRQAYREWLELPVFMRRSD